MIGPKITEISVVVASISGYCAREYDIISPDQFQVVLMLCVAALSIILYRHFFTYGSRK